MILLLTDGQPSTVRSILCQTGQKIAFLELQKRQFRPSFDAVLEDGQLEIAVIECFVNENRCLELLGDIKKRRPDVPVIFVLSSGSDRLVIETLSRGARYCFKKPFDVVLFKELTRALIKLKRASRERRAPLLPTDTKPAESAEITTDMPENILRAVNFIEDHVGDRSLGIERLARIAGMSPFHFCRIFKKCAAKSPMQYISCLRVEKAKELLKHDSANMSVSQIATALGFYDSSNFNKHFKKVTGLTPSAFKLKAKTAPSK